ncbi:type II toxin-antitoxin system RelB/DinJ family antitoxin [Treponema pectinovorum]|uniref:type II toxin-antitoxin system RelB/DinJ family antitoxin n=1 Tax=Treponema pectinovorum TaxID=164 RepID=UPI0011F171EF|nr:type II toxin-antitoxin system RelB/DinJ family antitoxin [Treponema pectinovorum]
MANLTITLDDQDKKDISAFCEQVGMTVSGLYNVFTKQVIREGRIPFEISVDRPNRKTIKAMKEGDRIANDPKVKGYTVEEFFEEMKSW